MCSNCPSKPPPVLPLKAASTLLISHRFPPFAAGGNTAPHPHGHRGIPLVLCHRCPWRCVAKPGWILQPRTTVLGCFSKKGAVGMSSPMVSWSLCVQRVCKDGARCLMLCQCLFSLSEAVCHRERARGWGHLPFYSSFQICL